MNQSAIENFTTIDNVSSLDSILILFGFIISVIFIPSIWDNESDTMGKRDILMEERNALRKELNDLRRSMKEINTLKKNVNTLEKEKNTLEEERTTLENEKNNLIDKFKRFQLLLLPNGTQIKYEGCKRKIDGGENVKMIGKLQKKKHDIEQIIEYNKKKYSPSGFGKEGYGTAVNGWDGNITAQINGEWVPIDDIHKHV